MKKSYREIFAAMDGNELAAAKEVVQRQLAAAEESVKIQKFKLDAIERSERARANSVEEIRSILRL
jgi:hypothetical protein